MEVMKSKNNKIMLFIPTVILGMFILGWILPVGIDKLADLSFEEYIFSTYTVFTQFGFLIFSFLVAFSINREYASKTILFYDLLGYRGLTFYIKKITTLLAEMLMSILVCLLLIAVFFSNFTGFFQIFFLFAAVTIHHVLVISVFSFLTSNMLVSIGLGIVYWIGSIFLAIVFPHVKMIAFFDASKPFYGQVEQLLLQQATWLPAESNIDLVLFLLLLTCISLAVVKLTEKRWLQLGIKN